MFRLRTSQLVVHLLRDRLSDLVRVGFLDACDETAVYRTADYLLKRNGLFALDTEGTMTVAPVARLV